MIFIVVKFTIRPDKSSQWISLTEPFTLATRSEPGNVMFEWSQSTDDPHQFVLVEAFASGEAGARHVASEHFRAAMAWMPEVIARTPDIVNVEVEGTGWSTMAELSPSTGP